MGTQRIRPALFRSNLRDSHFQTGGIATDISCLQIYSLFHSTMKKCDFAPKKNGTAFPVTKVEDFTILLTSSLKNVDFFIALIDK